MNLVEHFFHSRILGARHAAEGRLMKSMSCTMSRCRFAACILEISLASDRRCCRPARRSSRIWGSVFLDRTGLAILHIENAVVRRNWNRLFRHGNDLATKDRFNFRLQLLLNGPWWTISVHRLEAIDLLHLLKLLLNLLLVLNETVVHVLGPVDIHARLPVIEYSVLPEIAFNQDFRTHGDIENGIRHERYAVNLLDPLRLHAAHDAREPSVCRCIGRPRR